MPAAPESESTPHCDTDVIRPDDVGRRCFVVFGPPRTAGVGRHRESRRTRRIDDRKFRIAVLLLFVSGCVMIRVGIPRVSRIEAQRGRSRAAAHHPSALKTA